MNCSASGDSWARDGFTCTIPPVFSASCVIASGPAPSGNVHCSVRATFFWGRVGSHVCHTHQFGVSSGIL